MTWLAYIAIAAAVAAALIALLLKRPEMALVGLVLASPFGLFYIGAAQLITVLGIGVIGVMIASRWAADQQPIPRNALTGAAAFWILTVILSVLFSPYVTDTALFGTWLVVSALLAVAVTGIVEDRARLKPVLAAWLVSAIVITLAGQFIKPPVAVDAEASAEYGGAVITGRATSVFGQPNEYGTYCMILGLVALACVFRARGWLRWLAILTTVCACYGLIQSYSRGAWIGFVVGVVVLSIIENRARWPVLLVGGAVIVAFLGVAATVPNASTVQLVSERVGSILNPADNPDDDRPAIMAEAFRQFAAHPVLGVGPNGFPLEGATSRSLEATVGGVHAHNVVLTVAAEQGILGLIAMAVIAAALLVNALPVLPVVVRRLKDAPDSGQDWVAGVLTGTIAALSGMMIEGMVDAPLRNALMRTTLWFTVGLGMSAALILRGDSVDQGPERPQRADEPIPAGSPPSDS